VPPTHSSDRPGVALAEREAPSEDQSYAMPAFRKPDGAIARFDEIVTPHPVVAFLFRRRTFLVLLGILAMVPFAHPNPGMLIAGLVLALFAEACRIWSAGTIHKTAELTTAGPYAYVRHPLYVGSFLHAVAYSLMSGRWESFLFAIPLFLLLYSAAVSTEEAMLHKLFGERYAEYCRRVPRFIPRLRAAQGGHGRFAWQQVWLNKEYVNLIWMVVLIGLFVARLFLQRPD
jgi:protein-S-isoprenylcysteine O-methyltransferase Ste14